jgi:hypothetical protein
MYIGIPTTYLGMMSIVVWSGVVPTITTNILGARVGYNLTNSGHANYTCIHIVSNT